MAGNLGILLLDPTSLREEYYKNLAMKQIELLKIVTNRKPNVIISFYEKEGERNLEGRVREEIFQMLPEELTDMEYDIVPQYTFNAFIKPELKKVIDYLEYVPNLDECPWIDMDNGSLKNLLKKYGVYTLILSGKERDIIDTSFGSIKRNYQTYILGEKIDVRKLQEGIKYFEDPKELIENLD